MRNWRRARFRAAVVREVLRTLVLLLAPFAPFLAAELWEDLGEEGTVLRAEWPRSDPALAKEDELEIPVQINGKLVTVVRVAADADAKTIEAAALGDEKVQARIAGKTVAKVIVVPGKLVNLVVEVKTRRPRGSDAPLRGTQSLVGQMGWVIDRPLLIALEVAWRWLFGIPFLAVCWMQAQQILVALPLETAGFNEIDPQNPWVAAVQLTHVWGAYQPLVASALRWLLPLAAVAWVIVSGLGRSVVLKRMEPELGFRPVSMIALQAAWLGLMALTVWGWLSRLGWVAATHIRTVGEPDLVGYSIWVIFLSLGFFTAWALVSWPLLLRR